MISERVISRLFNFKFDQAFMMLMDDTAGGLANPTPVEYETVKALAESYRDVGWFTGNQAIIVTSALENIGVKFEEA